jgi:hypothetical protein
MGSGRSCSSDHSESLTTIRTSGYRVDIRIGCEHRAGRRREPARDPRFRIRLLGSSRRRSTGGTPQSRSGRPRCRADRFEQLGAPAASLRVDRVVSQSRRDEAGQKVGNATPPRGWRRSSATCSDATFSGAHRTMCDSARLPHAESRDSDDPFDDEHHGSVTDILMRGLHGNDGRLGGGHRSGAGTIGLRLQQSFELPDRGEISLRRRRLLAVTTDIRRPPTGFHVRYSSGTSIAFQSDLFA